MDEDILRTVEKISGKLSRDCYYDLCCLVKAAIPRMPGTFSMETLYPEAQRYSEKEKDTLAKALSRAAEDIWDCGDRAELQKLFQRVLREKPTPKDLVRVLALSIWRRRKAVPAAGALSGYGDPAPPAIRIQRRILGTGATSGGPAAGKGTGRGRAAGAQTESAADPYPGGGGAFSEWGRSAAGPLNRGGSSRGRLLLCFAPGVLQELLHLGGVGFLGVQQPLREISDLTVSTGVVPQMPGTFGGPHGVSLNDHLRDVGCRGVCQRFESGHDLCGHLGQKAWVPGLLSQRPGAGAPPDPRSGGTRRPAGSEPAAGCHPGPARPGCLAPQCPSPPSHGRIGAARYRSYWITSLLVCPAFPGKDVDLPGEIGYNSSV